MDVLEAAIKLITDKLDLILPQCVTYEAEADEIQVIYHYSSKDNDNYTVAYLVFYAEHAKVKTMGPNHGRTVIFYYADPSFDDDVTDLIIHVIHHHEPSYISDGLKGRDNARGRMRTWRTLWSFGDPQKKGR